MERNGTPQRTVLTISRKLEFFSKAELTTQLGCGPVLWPLVLAKELIDNSLDACESVVAPRITVTLKPDSLTIADNGPGIPEDTIKKAVDYTIRVSDKRGYVGPTRGQLGNALKCVIAAPFVANGPGLVAEIKAGRLHHSISVNVVDQEPILGLNAARLATVQNGTSVTVHWRNIARL
ncbi:MAG: ATP-binding protein [Candidatus Binataceae bacterium]